MIDLNININMSKNITKITQEKPVRTPNNKTTDISNHQNQNQNRNHLL